MKKLISICLSFLILCLSFTASGNASVFSAAVQTPQINLTNQNSFKITDSFVSDKNNKTIIFIQDLHGSTQVQKNISEIIRTIENKYKPDYLFVEGLPSNENNISILQDISKYNFYEELLNKNLLTGPEYYLVKNNTNMKIYGLEDFDIYLKNIERAANIIEDSEYLKNTYGKLKEEIFNKINKSKKLQKYIDYNPAKKDVLSKMNQPIIKYKDLHDYLYLSNNIKNINLKKANKEYKYFIKDLKENLNFTEYNNIMKYSVQQKTDKFYNALYNEISKEKYIGKYNNLHKMLDYFKQKNDLNIISFISQKDKYFNDFLNSEDTQNTEEIFILKMTQLFENFLNLSISYDEYKFFTNNYQRYINLLSKLLAQDYYQYDELLFCDIVFDYHYTNALRNNIFVNNILSKFNNKNSLPQTAVVVAGGFHSSILKQIKDNNISYILITPEIKDNFSNEIYNEILLSSLEDFETAALAPVRIMTAGLQKIPQGIKEYFFTKLAISTVGKTPKISAKRAESQIQELADKFFNQDVSVSIKKNVDNTLTAETKLSDGRLIIFKLSPRKNISSQKEDKLLSDIDSKLISFVKRLFNIFQSSSMRINPKSQYSSLWTSKRLGKRKNFKFTLSMFYSLIKKYDKSYTLMMEFAKSKNVSTLTYTINFDTDFNEDSKSARGFKRFQGKTIDIIVEKQLADRIDKEKIIQILDAAIRRVNNPIRDVKDTLFIGIVDKSTNLFEDHLNNGFIGVNEGILHIEDKVIKQAVLEAGLIHEISHELKGPLNASEYREFEDEMMFADIKFIIEYVAKIKYGEDADINKILFTNEYYKYIVNRIQNAFLGRNTADKNSLFVKNVRFMRKLNNYKYNIEDIAEFIRRKDFSIDDRRGQLHHIENAYLQNHPETQQILFSSLTKAEDDDMPMEEFLEEYITEERREEIETRIQELTKKFRNMLSISNFEQETVEEKVRDFKKDIYAALKIMYNEMPSYVFGIFYNEQGVIAEHSLNHSLDLIDSAIQILELEPQSIERTDFRAVIFAALFHDISCSLLRLNHEQNSATWARTILNRYLNHPDKYMNEDERIYFDSSFDIEKIYYLCLGHKKAKGGIPRTEHERYYESKLVHDADGLAATLNLKRILNVWVRMGEDIFNPDLDTATRIKLIRENKYLESDGGDAINDLIRQFIRRDPNLYLTQGATEKIRTSKSDQHALHDFLLSPETIKFLQKNNINLNREDIIKILDDTLEAFTENYQKYGKTIVISEDSSYTEEERKVSESVFDFKAQISLLFKIIQNLFNSGKTVFKQNIAISDIHGGYGRFAELLINLLDSTYDTSLKQDTEINDDIIERMQINMNNNTFYILGDLLDRGDRQVEAFELIKRIADTGKMKYVIGNHDLYAFMNLLGLHLPYYKNYKGIKDDYTDFKGRNVKSLLETLNDILRTQASNSEMRLFWAEQLYEYMKYADEQQKNIWSKEEAKLQKLFYETFNFELDKNGKDILNNQDKFLDKENVSDETKKMFKDEIFINFHKKFFGRNVGIAVYTGIRAVNKMSINWWIDRLNEVKELKKKYPQYISYWEQLETFITQIINGQEEKLIQEEKKYISLKTKLGEENILQIKNLAWGIIDAVMYRNYESTEWNALDWSYHKNWGGGDNGFIAQRSRQLKAQNKEEINQVNYFNDSMIKDLMHFYQDNFYLYRIDEYGFYYMHSLLPVDDDGDVSLGYVDKDGLFHDRDEKGKRIKGFFYKGNHYKGRNIFKGLHLIAQDIRDYEIESNDLSEISEALTLLTAIYADNTTRIKPANLKEIKKKYGSFNKILAKKGVTTIIAGHNPIQKLDNQFEYMTLRFFNKEFKILNLMHIDGNMSSGYAPPKGAGTSSLIGGGINIRGFVSGTATEITASSTPDVSRSVFIASALLNLFPMLRRIFYLTEIIYNKIILYRQYLNAERLKLFNTTFINILNTKDDLNKIESVRLKNLDTISITSYENIFDIRANVQSLGKENFYFNDKEIPVEISLNKIPTVKEDLRIISFNYNKIPGVDYTNFEQDIIEYIIEQIKNNAYGKHISTNINMVMGENLSNRMKTVSKTPDRKITSIIKNYFGFIPTLYDVNTFRTEPEIYDITTINSDDIRTMLAAS